MPEQGLETVAVRLLQVSTVATGRRPQMGQYSESRKLLPDVTLQQSDPSSPGRSFQTRYRVSQGAMNARGAHPGIAGLQRRLGERYCSLVTQAE
jgi:hypothetical protein